MPTLDNAGSDGATAFIGDFLACAETHMNEIIARLRGSGTVTAAPW